MNSHHCRMILEKLADYEDLEEQGLLVRLPCKEAYTQDGCMVYLIHAACGLVECMHLGLRINPIDAKPYIMLAADEEIFPYGKLDPENDLDPTDWCTDTTEVEVSEIGKTLFFDRWEAEKKLKEMEK